jgi:hypothetical protein
MFNKEIYYNLTLYPDTNNVYMTDKCTPLYILITILEAFGEI